MSGVIASLLPLGIGAAIGGPAWIIMALILVRSPRGVAKATAFAAGAIIVRLLQFVLFSRIFGAIVSAEGEDVFELIPCTLLVLAGILLIITAIKTWWWHKVDDPDAPPSKWLAILENASALRASGMAFVMMTIGVKQWVFTLSAIAVIDEKNIGTVGSVLAYLFFIVVAHSFVLGMITTSATAPAHAEKLVDTALSWLKRNSRVLTVLISLAFGTWFLVRGMSSFIAHGAAKISAS